MKRNVLTQYLIITASCALYAVGFNWMFDPNHISVGGFTGLGQIINYLLEGLNVILNFEEVDDAQCQRVLDMVSGAAFALRGSVERISHRNYLVAPTGVEIVRPEASARAAREAREARDASAGYGAW